MGSFVPKFSDNNRVNREVYLPACCSRNMRIIDKTFPSELQGKISEKTWQNFVNDFEAIQSNTSMCCRIWIAVFTFGASEICTCSSKRFNQELKECLDKWNKILEKDGVGIMRRRRVFYNGKSQSEVNWIEISISNEDSIQLNLQRNMDAYECCCCCRYKIGH